MRENKSRKPKGGKGELIFKIVGILNFHNLKYQEEKGGKWLSCEAL